MYRKIALLICAASLNGCIALGAAGIYYAMKARPTSQFEVSSSNTYTLNDAPKTSSVIKLPIADIKEVYYKIAIAEMQKKQGRGKFESDAEYQAKVEKASNIDNVFIVKNLDTQKCSKYDFSTGTYSIDCAGFKETDVLKEETKSKNEIVANPYRTRQIELIEDSKYYLAVNVSAKLELNVSVDEAKKLDRDLMIGVLVKPSATTSDDSSGCGRYDVAYKPYGQNVCNKIAMDTGMALETWKKQVEVDKLLEMVVYRKSDNKVVLHRLYAPSK